MLSSAGAVVRLRRRRRPSPLSSSIRRRVCCRRRPLVITINYNSLVLEVNSLSSSLLFDIPIVEN